jgi:hypothetical protein
LPGDGYNGKVYISPSPGFTEDDGYVYQRRRPLYGMPSAARAWHTTTSPYLKSQGCALVGFERSMWCITIQGHTIFIAAHIDDFIIACADRATLDAFRQNLLARFDGPYEGEVHTSGARLREILLPAVLYILSQRHFAEDVLRTFAMRDCIPALTPMKPCTRLTKDQRDFSRDPAFHRRYRGILGSLGYLVNMTRPDLTWSYSELSKYVQYPGQAHMDAALHGLRMHGELLRLLFLQAHWETEAHFTATGMPSQQNSSESFRFKRAAFFQSLKSKVGLAAAKAAALRININTQGAA